jgi:hypothetical protein
MSNASAGGDPEEQEARDARVHGYRPEAGLCSVCRHAHVVQTRKGSAFYRCRLSETDPEYARYPPLPVLRCGGFVPLIQG